MATTNLDAVYDQAQRFLEENDAERAIAVVQHILDHFPDNLEAHRLLGESYLVNRRFEQAEEAFRHVLKVDPENIPAHVGLGITYERQGKLDRAVNEFEQALEIKPDMTELRTQLLRLYMDAWGSEHAQLRLSRPGLARLYAKGHMLTQAIQEFRSVVSDQPERFDARVGLAEALWRDGQEEMAVSVCQEILSERHDVLKANLLLGYIKLAAGDPEGERYWRMAQQIDPAQGVAQIMFGTLPEVAPLETTLPVWDEQDWRQQRERDKEEKRTATAARKEREKQEREQQAREQREQKQVPAQSHKQPVVSPVPVGESSGGGSVSDDDFLANLLGVNAFAAPAKGATDGIDGQTDLTEEPFSFDEFEGLTDIDPFRVDSIDEGISPRMDESVSPPPPAEVLPAVTEEEPDTPEPPPAPPEEPPAESSYDDDVDMSPLSLTDLGLSPEEIASMEQLQGEGLDTTSTEEPSPPPSESPPDPMGKVAEASSFDVDMGLDVPPQEDETDMPDLEPFDWAEGLDDMETSDREDASSLPTESVDDSPDMQPFAMPDMPSFDDPSAGSSEGDVSVDLSADDPFADMSNMQPFDWSSDTDTEDASATGSESAFPDESGLDESGFLGLEPFNLDELDLSSEPDLDASSLPPALQPFSLETSEPPAMPGMPPVPEPPPPPPPQPEPEHEEGIAPDAGAYSWQTPSSKKMTDFLRESDTTSSSTSDQPSIFNKLKHKRQEIPDDEPEPLPDVALDDEAMMFFSDDDVSLRVDDDDDLLENEAMLEGIGAAPPAEADMAEVADEDIGEPEVTPLSLAELGLSEEEIAELNATGGDVAEPESAAPPAEADMVEVADEDIGEPEVTPLSLAELGLSEEEIAELNATGGGDVAEPESAAPPAEADMVEVADEDIGEPEVTPLSLAELGLSEEEIAELEQSGGEAPATAEAPAEQAFSDEPEVAPLSLAELGLSEEEIAELNATGEGEEAPTETETAPTVDEYEEDDTGLTPFSFDDLSLGGEDMGMAEQPEPEPQPEESMPASSPHPGKAPETQLLDDVDIQPFSLDDLGLDDTSPFNLGDIEEGRDDKLGLTAEELAGLDEFGGSIGGGGLGLADSGDDVSEESMPNTGDPALDRLIVLGQRQGFVDLTDIINVVEDPVAESERIEDIGRALYRAGIEIRDGDEVIDMEEEYDEYDEYYDDEYVDSEEPGSAEESDVAPLSLEELGLSEEEISTLGLESEPKPEAEPEQPVSRETAMLDMDSLDEATMDILNESVAEDERPTADTPAPIDEPEAEEQEPEVTPLSLEELGLSADEIALIGMNGEAGEQEAPAPTEDAEPEEPQPAPAPPETPTAEEAEPEVAPLSLEELGLSADEIAMLGLEGGGGAAETALPPDEITAPEPEPEPEPAPPPAEPEPAPASPEPPDTAAEGDPEIAPLSLEELGLSADEIAMLGLGGGDEPPAAPEPEAPAAEETEPEPPAEQPTEPTAAPVPEEPDATAGGGDPEIAPLSLEELGLSADEIAMLGLGGGGETPAAPTPDEPATTEPDTSPPAAQQPESQVPDDIPSLSLEELGLTEEEIQLLGLAASEASGASKSPPSSASAAPATPRPARQQPPPPQKPPEPEESDVDEFDFDIAGEAPAAPIKRTKPREVEEEEQKPISPEDAAFVPEPLEALDDIWDLPDTVSAEVPARATIEPRPQPQTMPERPAKSTEAADRNRVSQRERRAAWRNASSERPRPAFRKDKQGDAAPAAETTHAAQKTAQETEEKPVFLPTGNDDLDELLRQLDDEPDSEGLYLAVAHLAMETAHYEVALYHYKYLVKQQQLLEPMLEDVLELVQGVEDQAVLPRFHRLIGDVYMKLKRIPEAMAAYKGKLS